VVLPQPVQHQLHPLLLILLPLLLLPPQRIALLEHAAIQKPISSGLKLTFAVPRMEHVMLKKTALEIVLLVPVISMLRTQQYVPIILMFVRKMLTALEGVQSVQTRR